MIQKDDIPKALDHSYVDPFIMTFKAKLCPEEMLAFNAMMMAYHFSIFRCPEAYEKFLREKLEPLPANLSEALDKFEKNGEAIDWFSFNSNISGGKASSPVEKID